MIDLLKRFGGPYRLNLIAGPACKLLEVLFDLMTPLVIARMIDAGVGARSMREVLISGALLVGMAVVGMGFALVCQKMASRASQGVGTSLRDALFRHINEFSRTEVDRFGTPSLTTRIINDVNQVQLAVALAIRQLIRWPFLAVGSMAAACLIDLRLGVIFLVSTPLIGGLFWLIMARCVPLYQTMQRQLDRIALIVREGLAGTRVVRAHVREGHERARLREAADMQAAVATMAARLSSVLNPATFLVMNLAVCAILWAGGQTVNAGGLTQGEIVAFVNYMTQTLLSIVYVANLVVVFTRAEASAGRIREVLDCPPSITDAGALPVAVSPDGAAPALRLDGVSFTFAGASSAALQGVSLAVDRGQTLGVIGGTGSGKSTLVSLLARLYEVGAGSVEVLGTDVRRWPVAQLRRSIGMVPQKAELLSGTIRSNLRWRAPEATDEELWRALEMAQAAPFVRDLPDGLDAPVEAGGANFSGGQRQRLTIARALVGDPALLILDDAASALDLKTDAALRRALHSRDALGAVAAAEPSAPAVARVPVATVIVSQRVSSVRDADLICVLSHGRVAGLGTHEELVAGCEIYREICASQLTQEEAGPSAVPAVADAAASDAAVPPCAPEAASAPGLFANPSAAHEGSAR